MPPSPTGPFYATSATAGVDWTNISNATGVEDGNNASNLTEGPGGGGHAPTQLVTSGHGFNLPATAIIDGIKLEAKVTSTTSSDQTIQIGKPVKLSTSTPNFGQFWPSSLAWVTWGGATALWGRTDWTYADINDATFGASISAFATHGTDNLGVDAVRITIYWHTAPADVPKRYLYKVFNNGSYLGNLQGVTSEFSFSQDINTGGTQIQVTCAISPDTSILPVDTLTDESGNILTDESSNNLTTEGTVPSVGVGLGNQIIRNGNQVIVYEFGYWHPNGIPVFRGVIQRWEADYGGDGGDDRTIVLIYSDGSDLDNHLIRSAPFVYTLDQTQATQNARDLLSQASSGGSWNFDGQTFTVGGGVNNLGAISLMLDGTATVTINVYNSPALTTLLASTSQNVSVVGPTEVQFGLPSHITTTPTNQYFFAVSVAAGQSIWIQYQNTNPYSGGAMYNSNFGGGGGGSYAAQAANDLYFKTFSSNGDTLATFTTVDPTTGMLEPILNDYISEGGLLTYSASSIQATGLSITYQFNTNTVYEALRATLSLAPYGFYYYVDLGTDVIYFKQNNTVADVVLTKGLHIDKMTLVATIEQIINTVYFTGGVTAVGPPPVNLYKFYQDATSAFNYGPHLDRPTNNLVTDPSSANAISLSEIGQLKREQYQTKVTVVDRVIDLTTLKPGMIVGFNGFGTFVDSLLLEIVRIDYTPEEAILTLGILPKRLHQAVEQVIRGVIGLNTVANPVAPS